MAWCANGHWQEGVSSHHISACHRCAMDQRTAHLTRFRDAVFEAAVAYAAWCKRDGPVTPEAEEQAVCTAVDDYFAAKEDS